jgi:LysR family transcriptional regulator, glycine cleavage system transcriptional activator
MNRTPHRPLAIGPLRAFEAVARRLSFSAAADELYLTQPAISRQIKSLEDELGAPLFVRGTRKVELTAAGFQLQRGVLPLLLKLDTTVRQIRSARGRRTVSVATFASFASLWLLPRLPGFERTHPDIDIRISAGDGLTDLDDPDVDLVLRYCRADNVPAATPRLFGEVISPVVSASLAALSASGQAPPLRTPADLAQHTLLEEDDHRPSADYLSWRHWLRTHDVARLEPARWLYLNYTYQQVQAALGGSGVALGRLAMIGDNIARGELVEPFGPARRVESPYTYWLLDLTAARGTRPEVAAFAQWVAGQAAVTRAQMEADAGAGANPSAPAPFHRASAAHNRV